MRDKLLDTACVAIFEKAMGYELSHFHLYKELSNAMQSVGFFGAQAYFLSESDEEVTHYQKHVDFLNDMGILGKTPAIKPQGEYPKSLKDALKIAYDNEKDLLDFYKEFYKKEGVEYPEIAQHLLFFIQVQREHVGFYADMINRLEAAGSTGAGAMLIDKELKKLANG